MHKRLNALLSKREALWKNVFLYGMKNNLKIKNQNEMNVSQFIINLKSNLHQKL